MEHTGEKKLARRNVSPQLAMSVLYGLNHSFGKIITAGFELSIDNGILIPVVKIISNSFTGITLGVDEWEVFKNDYPRILRYFIAWGKEAENMYGERTVYSTHHILLTSCYQQRAISLASNEVRKEENSGKEEIDGAASKYNRRNYTPNIVLQASTFRNLVEISKCVDLHIQQMKRTSMVINQCMSRVMSYVTEHLGSDKSVERASVVRFLESRDNVAKLFEQMRSELNITDPEFAKNSLDLVLMEITTLFREKISECINSTILQSA